MSAIKTKEKSVADAALEQTEAVTSLVPANFYGDYADVVAEAQKEAAQMGTQDFTMPFIAIVQSLSPARQKDKPEYIKGAEEGDFYNTVSRELFKPDTGLEVVPVRYEFVYNVWRPRDQGGGFCGSYPTQAEALAVAVGLIMEEIPGIATKEDAAALAVRRDKTGWVRDTMNQYVLAKTAEGDFVPVLLSLTSSKLTPGRKWNTVLQMVKAKTPRPPVRWDRVWHLATVSKTNAEGTFYTIKPGELVRETTDVEWKQAAEFFKMLKAGSVKVNYEKAGETDVTDEAQITDKEGDEKF